jgi:hypothetical protein
MEYERLEAAAQVLVAADLPYSENPRSDADAAVRALDAAGWLRDPAAAGDQAKAIVKAVLAELEDRKGFSWWWGELESDIRSQIKKALTRIVNRLLKG